MRSACQRSISQCTGRPAGEPVSAGVSAGQMEQAGIQAGIPVQVKKQSPARLRFQASHELNKPR